MNYLVRYGRMGHVGRFAADATAGPLERGQPVVLRTARGTELGVVLAPSAAVDDIAADAAILRRTTPEDLERARDAARARHERLAACERVFDDGTWPLALVDVEPLLDEGRTVLYYLGPHRLDTAGLREALRAGCGLDAVLVPVGRDEPAEDEGSEPDGCGSCGADGGGGCGSCGEPDGEAQGGCGGCAVKDLVRGKARRLAARS